MTLEERIAACSAELENCPFCSQHPAMAPVSTALPALTNKGEPVRGIGENGERRIEVWCVGSTPGGEGDFAYCAVAPNLVADTPEEARDLWNLRS